jgi:aryl-alcohol dehydrogenase-like predicted oxidoreductase
MAEYCIGTAQFGMDYGIANQSGKPKQDEIDRIVEFAVESNIRYFDTAQSYGESETILGKAVSKLPDVHNIRMISKLAPDLQESSSAIIIESVKSSLEKLNVGSLYGFLGHRVEAIKSDSFLTAIEILKNEELVIKAGVSVYTPEEALSVIKQTEVDILQIPFNILDKRWFDKGIFEKAEENNIQLFFRSIFLQGLIFLNENELMSRKMDWAKTYLKEFNDLVQETPFSPLELAFGILTNVPGNNVIIMGLDSSNQLWENLKILEKINIDNKISDEWWLNLPVFPEKFLNPSLWN